MSTASFALHRRLERADAAGHPRGERLLALDLQLFAMGLEGVLQLALHPAQRLAQLDAGLLLRDVGELPAAHLHREELFLCGGSPGAGLGGLLAFGRELDDLAVELLELRGRGRARLGALAELGRCDGGLASAPGPAGPSSPRARRSSRAWP
jgi:hypothetical protein